MFHSAKRGGGGRREDSWIISSPMKIHSHLETIPWIFPPDIIPRTIVIRVVRDISYIFVYFIQPEREKKNQYWNDLRYNNKNSSRLLRINSCIPFSFSFLFTRHTLLKRLIYSFFHPDEWNKDTRFSNDSTIFS